MQLRDLRSGFSSTFWIANTLELFERMSFYGAKAVLTVFIAEKVGLGDEAGTISGRFSSLIFALPIFAGVIVDRYGFKKSLMACFFIFCVGYFLIGLAGLEYGQQISDVIGRKTYIYIVLFLTAVGGSLIKPCIVGTVSLTTTEQTKAMGYSVYYTLANIGGMLGPIMALTVRENIGIEFVLIVSSIISFLLFLGALFFFKEPMTQAMASERKTFGKVFSDMLLVFTNFRFILFLIIFSGFWLMFWQIYYLLPFYSKDVLDFEQFEILESVDAFCIIFLTIPMAALVRKWKPITAMTLGFVFASLSWILIGSFGTLTVTIIAIGLFALGEATQSPRFYEYVASLAPKDQLGTYMGFAFLPVAIGAFFAGSIADWLRLNYMESNPSLMWYIVGAIGLVSTLLMILYNIFIAPKPKSV